MARRLVINTKSGSPFKVSMSGTDALGASWENLLFDGDQAPLLLYSSSYINMPVISAGNTAYMQYSSLVPLFPRPAGQYPTFAVMWRAPRQPNPEVPVEYGEHSTPGCIVGPRPADSGGGGVVGTDYFAALNYCRSGNAGPVYPQGNYINFLIFRNYFG